MFWKPLISPNVDKTSPENRAVRNIQKSDVDREEKNHGNIISPMK